MRDRLSATPAPRRSGFRSPCAHDQVRRVIDVVPVREVLEAAYERRVRLASGARVTSRAWPGRAARCCVRPPSRPPAATRRPPDRPSSVALSRWSRQQHPQRCQHAPRATAMHRHAEPIGGLFALHRLDALSHGTHVVAATHRRERPEQQSEREGGVLPHRVRALAAGGASFGRMPAAANRLRTRCSISSRLRPRSPAIRIGDLTCGVAGAGNCQISYSVSDAPCDPRRNSYRGADAGVTSAYFGPSGSLISAEVDR